MSIRIVFHSELSKIAGKGEMELEPLPRDVRSLLDKLISMFPALEDELFDGRGRLNMDYQILLNGKGINAQGGTEARLEDGDEIAFLMPLSGGL